MMSISKFIDGLPSYDETNFCKYDGEQSNRTLAKKPSLYLPTTDHPVEQIIVTEKRHILLRYLHLYWDKKKGMKRDGYFLDGEELPMRKRIRLDDEFSS